MSFFKNKIILIMVIIMVSVLFLGGILNATGGANGPVANIVGTAFSPIQKAVSSVVSVVDNFTVFIWEMRGYKAENERLLEEMNELQKQNRSITDYKEENERLKELLELKTSISQYPTKASRIISYDPNNWYDTIVIDSGTKGGLDKEGVVLTGAGIVGQIVDIGVNWARVSSILSVGHSVGARVVRTGEIAIVEGDITLAKSGYCKMEFLDKSSSIAIGDLVETSGLGGIYPAGMMIGRVREIQSDNSGGLQYAVIEPSVDFNHLHEVLVIVNE